MTSHHYLPRRVRRHGYTFYATTLILFLFALYSYLKTSIQDQDYSNGPLQVRAEETSNLECRLVHKASDKCAFVRANCFDEDAGLIPYLELYYCSLPKAHVFAFTVLVIWISLLFSTIGIAASDFLCINLSTIATVLGMSESLTGVTFLAFGNGSPDVFSTFAAMGSHSGGLAIGELVGAAGFISAVVAGSMALVKPFKVARKSFIRDVGFFTVAASFSMVFLVDGNLRIWECAVMVGFYLFYVVFVVVWHWWLARQRRKKLTELAARLHHDIPNHQELDVPTMEVDEESRPVAESTGLLQVPQEPHAAAPRSPLTPSWVVEDIDDDDEDDETRDQALAELQSNMRISRASHHQRRNTITPIRPSLIGVLEFRNVLNSLEKRSTNTAPIYLRRYSDDPDRPTVSTPLILSHVEEEDASDGPPQRISFSRQRSHTDTEANFHRNPGIVLSGSSSDHENAIISAGSSPRPTALIHKPSGNHLTVDFTPKRPNQSPERSSDNSSTESPTRLATPVNVFHQPDYTETHHASRSPLGVSPLAHSPHDHRKYLGSSRRSDSDQSSSAPQSPGLSLQVPKIHFPQPDHRKSSLHETFPAYTDSPTSMSPANSRPPSIRLPPPSMSVESTGNLSYLGDDGDVSRTIKWWPYQYLPSPTVLYATLFPTVYGWRSKSLVEKLLGVVTVPSVLLLTITLPVTESNIPELEDEPVMMALESSRSNTLDTWNSPEMPTGTHKIDEPHESEAARARRMSRYMSDCPPPQRRMSEELDEDEKKPWNRWLMITQVFTAPLFTVSIIWANLEDSVGLVVYIRMVLGALVFSLILLAALLLFTTSRRPPKYPLVFCLLGFMVAVAWISTIANEVVGVLKAFGTILDMSDAILGLTIFAVGNSLGDLVADVTVAKLGFPMMALSACFGGPMLNILIGVGVAGLYQTIRHGAKHHAKHPDKPVSYKPYELDVSITLMISGISLLVTLVGLLIAVPLNKWRMDRRIGIGLITLWVVSTIGNVIVEITGVGKNLDIGSQFRSG